jgi:hypothetical protein
MPTFVVAVFTVAVAELVLTVTGPGLLLATGNGSTSGIVAAGNFPSLVMGSAGLNRKGIEAFELR